MRLAVLSDIHGNLAALGAVLNDAARLSPDAYIVLGDIVVGAADSLACWDQIRALGCPVVRGNHETYVLTYGTSAAPADWATTQGALQYAPVMWAAAQFRSRKTELERLPMSLSRPEYPNLSLVHASFRSDRDNISAYTPEAALSEMFAALQTPYLVRGHDHHAATRSWAGRQLITVGSVGLPLNGVCEAQYALLEQRGKVWQPQFRAVPYDVDDTLARFHSTGYLEAAGPMARLFYREIAFATYQIIPFLRGYTRWSAGSTLDLTASVARFIAYGS